VGATVMTRWRVELHWLQWPIDVRPVESWTSGRRWVHIHLGPFRFIRELERRARG